MHSYKSWIRVLTRILYAGGAVFLIVGLLLSAISTPALAAGLSLLSGSSLQQVTASPTCSCQVHTPTVPGPTPTTVSGGKSSLVFTSGCNCSCTSVSAVVCNVGSADMQAAVKWRLYFNAVGNPAQGTTVQSGQLGPLANGQCVNLSYTPSQAGNFAYHVEQEPNHTGPGSIWSNACMVSGSCFGTATATAQGAATSTHTATPRPTRTRTPTAPPVEITLTPTGTGTPPGSETVTPTLTSTPTPPGHETTTPTLTETPTAPPVEVTMTPTTTATRTSAPKAFNLSAVCGYASDTTLLWKVANNTSSAVSFTWKVVGSSETGSGSVGANSSGYFTTSLGDKTVELYVDNKLVDSEHNVAPCRQELQLSYVCTGTALEWFVHNPNSFSTGFTWHMDTGESGNGTAPGNSTLLLVTTAKGAHVLTLVWTDSRPGSHTVTLTSLPNTCPATMTPSPTATVTQTVPVPTITNTPTPSATPTNTLPPPPPVIITITPSQTATVTETPVGPTVTPSITPSVTLTLTPGVATVTPSVTPSVTLTPTTTLTPLAGFVPSFTPSVSPTATHIVTLPPPSTTVTSTPVLIPVTGVDLTRPVGANSLSIFGSLLTNIGLFTLGLALALTGVSSQFKDK